MATRPKLNGVCRYFSKKQIMKSRVAFAMFTIKGTNSLSKKFDNIGTLSLLLFFSLDKQLLLIVDA